MTRKRRPALLLALVAVSGLLLAGCTVNGGGWINSANYAKKATFGFTWAGNDCQPAIGEFEQSFPILVCDPTHAKGSWSDGSVKFRIAEGGLTSLVFDYEDECWKGEGTYISEGRQRGSGTIKIKLCDNGEPGIDNDRLSVRLCSGPYNGYQNEGTLRGGNLQQTKPPELP